MTETAPSPLDQEPIRAVLRQLLEAHELATIAGKDLWEFAVEITTLAHLGASHSQIRWLITEGLVEAQAETTNEVDRRRTFRKLHSLAMPQHTCLLLTARGRKTTTQLRHDPLRPAIDRASVANSKDPYALDRPQWDSQRRQLRFKGQLVKGYRVPAPMQEAILAAFEAAGWPHCIVGPVDEDHALAPKQRLPNTIRALNRSQSRLVLRFHGDGTGSRVCWALLPSGSPRSYPNQPSIVH